MTTLQLHAGRRVIEVSHADKLLYRNPDITEGEVAEYYLAVAPRMVPLLRDRPLVMERFPRGASEAGFIQKQVPEHFPDWIRTATLPKERGTIDHVVCCDRAGATLAYLTDQSCLVLHAWLSRVDRPQHPDQMILDLDPPGADRRSVGLVRDAARLLHEVLEDIGLRAFVKSTGSRGAHVHVPLDRRAGFEESRALARALAQVVADDSPGRFTVEARKANRGDRLYLDTMRNAYAQHAVAPYSLRALPGAPVAVPLDWAEITERGFHPRRYRLRDVMRDLDRWADPWAGMARARSSASRARQRLDRLRRPGARAG
jgi:bifunctional non-homologous end joining protein LigD